MKTIETIILESYEQADRFYNPELFRCLRQDLLSIGKSEEEIIKEFIEEAFITGYCRGALSK